MAQDSLTDWIRQDLAAGKVIPGAGVTMNTPLATELLAAAGADFLFQDGYVDASRHGM